MRILLTRRNAQKRAAAAASAGAEATAEGSNDEKITHSYAFDDLTDKENPDFRYEL